MHWLSVDHVYYIIHTLISDTLYFDSIFQYFIFVVLIYFPFFLVPPSLFLILVSFEENIKNVGTVCRKTTGTTYFYNYILLYSCKTANKA